MYRWLVLVAIGACAPESEPDPVQQSLGGRCDSEYEYVGNECVADLCAFCQAERCPRPDDLEGCVTSTCKNSAGTAIKWYRCEAESPFDPTKTYYFTGETLVGYREFGGLPNECDSYEASFESETDMCF